MKQTNNLPPARPSENDQEITARKILNKHYYVEEAWTEYEINCIVDAMEEYAQQKMIAKQGAPSSFHICIKEGKEPKLREYGSALCSMCRPTFKSIDFQTTKENFYRMKLLNITNP